MFFSDRTLDKRDGTSGSGAFFALDVHEEEIAQYKLQAECEGYRQGAFPQKSSTKNIRGDWCIVEAHQPYSLRTDPGARQWQERHRSCDHRDTRDTRLKFAFEPAFGIFKLKQLLADGLQWPYDYGFIPETLAEDGDPLDVLVLTDIPTFTGCLMECRILGLVSLVKDGDENDRLLAAPLRRAGVAQSSDEFEDVDDIPKDTVEGICRFLIEYSAEQGHRIEFKGVKSKKKAIAALERAMQAYQERRS